jgi:hypothetical protein
MLTSVRRPTLIGNTLAGFIFIFLIFSALCLIACAATDVDYTYLNLKIYHTVGRLHKTLA